MKLYNLTENYNNLWGLVDNDEIDLAIVEEAIQKVESSIEEKAQNIAVFIKSLDADADTIKAEEKRLADRRRAIENRRDGIKQYLQQQMELAGLDKVKGSTHTISLQNNPPSVQITDVDKIPGKFLTLIPEQYVPNKKELAEALKAGEDVEGAELTRGKSLRIR